MDKTQQYVIASTGTLIGIICIVISIVVDITSLSGIIISIFGTLFGGAGLFSFFNSKVSEVLGQIMKNMGENQEREINQTQHKPANSPQTGVVKGNQYNNYGKEETKEIKYNKTKVEKRLGEIKTELNNLKIKNHKEGNKIFSPLKKEVRGIIYRVYPQNPEASEKRLIHKVFWVVSSSTQEKEYQAWYTEDVEGLIETIDIILREMDLE